MLSPGRELLWKMFFCTCTPEVCQLANKNRFPRTPHIGCFWYFSFSRNISVFMVTPISIEVMMSNIDWPGHIMTCFCLWLSKAMPSNTGKMKKLLNAKNIEILGGLGDLCAFFSRNYPFTFHSKTCPKMLEYALLTNV